MYAVEFQTKITDGTIEIPLEYRERVQGNVRVIILSEQNLPAIDMIDYLINNPIKAPNFKPMTRDEANER